MNVTIAQKFAAVAPITFNAFTSCMFCMPKSANTVINKKPLPAPK